jgi:hypothetical protein
MTSAIENERWRVADEVANFLSVDRDACRRAFYGEPEERIYEVIRWVVAERDLPKHDPEQMIERWARTIGTAAWSKWRESWSEPCSGAMQRRKVTVLLAEGMASLLTFPFTVAS